MPPGRTSRLELRLVPAAALSRLLRHPAVTGVGIPDPLGPPTRIVADPPTLDEPGTERDAPAPDLRFAPGDFELRPLRGWLELWPVGPRRRLRNEMARLRLLPGGWGCALEIQLQRVGLGWWHRKRPRVGASELLFAIFDPVRVDAPVDPFRAAGP